MAYLDDIRAYWDADAATYDVAPGHLPKDAAVIAAWTAALDALLPAPPARVLDCGAGTGFLSLIAARLGHEVTARDISESMLARLAEHAAEEGLPITMRNGPAEAETDRFDVVMERHVLWTLVDPLDALRRWRAVAPEGRLIVFESIWGTADRFAALRGRGRDLIRELRGTPPDHHDSYPPVLRNALPLGGGTRPDIVVDLVGRAGWRAPRLSYLSDVRVAERASFPLPERLIGPSAHFAVLAH